LIAFEVPAGVRLGDREPAFDAQEVSPINSATRVVTAPSRSRSARRSGQTRST
jgi:hypothetical protein